MREIRTSIERWFNEGHRVALAQVTKTWGSSPRAAGSLLAVSDDARLAGSVSGGCIEGAVAQAALEAMESGTGTLEKFHATSERAQEVGLSCGGNVEVLVASLDPALFAVENALVEADREYVRLSVCDGPDALVGRSFLVAFAPDAENAMERAANPEGLELLDVPGMSACCAVVPCGLTRELGVSQPVLVDLAQRVLELPRTQATGHVLEGAVDWFFARAYAQPQLVCIGGTHISIHLAQMAKALGYRTVVVDPRGVFATEERFPFVDELLHEWPQQAFEHVELTPQTAVCALTHDPKIDVPALATALESPAFYIGSLGRVSTQLSRCEALEALGYSETQIGRVFGPIGLDLKGREPAEIALAVMAEITAVRHGGVFAMSTMTQAAARARVC